MTELKTVVVGMFQVNCHVLIDHELKEFVLIDAPGTHPLFEKMTKDGYTCTHLLLTHGHVDHVAGVKKLKSLLNCHVTIHKEDMFMYERAGSNQFSQMLQAETPSAPDSFLSEKDVFNVAGCSLEVIHTPGHTPGGVCFYSSEKAFLFSGDTLFRDSIGRTDLPGGNMDTLLKSIKSKLLVLPEDTEVHCGHGESTTIKKEKLTNPFL